MIVNAGASVSAARTPGKRRAVPVLALSPDEAAAALGVSRDFLDEHIAHELRWVRRGRRKLVAVVELERWLQASAARTLEGA
jgi:excisionase family DNA binding protein